MGTLQQLLEAQPTVVDDCLKVLDAEVADKSGLSGIAIKASFAAVKGVKPGFIREVVKDLIPQFAVALDPLYQEALKDPAGALPYLQRSKSRISSALLAITDQKAVKSSSGVVKGAYQRLRPAAERHVEAAVPRLAELLARYSAGR